MMGWTMAARERYLDIKFRKGRPFAAYLYLARQTSDTVSRTEEIQPGVMVDYAADGRAIGVEILSHLAINDLLRLLADRLGLKDLQREEIMPLATVGMAA